GTGRARHGSIRSPLWVGGGVAHGPRNDKNFARKVNKHMKALALATIICKKMKDGEVLFLDTLKLEEAKTKLAKNVLAALSKIQGFEALTRKKQNAALVAIPSKSTSTERGFRNIGTVSISELRNLNPLDVLRYKYLLISEPDQSVKYIAQKIS
ncbi:MAG TPA: 50S ribosomal protein L4, partial [Candidatus Paceibacterota bacterium]